MKCPKCSYLGFETGDRCKNCGYDFSLLTAPAPRDPDLPLREAEPFAGTSNQWLEELDRGLAGLQVPAAATARPDPLAPMPLDTVTAAPVTPPLPLFPLSSDDDQPLIKLPAAPRAPLSVRRTPDRPRLRAVPKPVRRGAAEAAPQVGCRARGAPDQPVAPLRARWRSRATR